MFSLVKKLLNSLTKPGQNHPNTWPWKVPTFPGIYSEHTDKVSLKSLTYLFFLGRGDARIESSLFPTCADQRPSTEYYSFQQWQTFLAFRKRENVMHLVRTACPRTCMQLGAWLLWSKSILLHFVVLDFQPIARSRKLRNIFFMEREE